MTAPFQTEEPVSTVAGRELLEAPQQDGRVIPERIAGSEILEPDQDDLDYATAAIGFHLARKLPDHDWTQPANQLARRFLREVGDDPSVKQRLADDVNTLWGLTDEDIAARIASGDDPGELGDVWDAMADVAWEVGATETATKLAEEASDAMRGTFDANTITKLAEEERAKTPLTRRGAFPTRGAISDISGRSGAWAWNAESNLLAVTFEEGGTVGVRPRPGFDPENGMDVLAEFVAVYPDESRRAGEIPDGPSPIDALFETANKVGRFLDEHPRVRDTVDALYNGFRGLPMVSLGVPGVAEIGPPGLPGRSPLATAEVEQETAEAEALEQVKTGDLPEELWVVGLANQILAQEATISPFQALTAAGEMVDENRDELEANYRELKAEELIENIREGTEDKSTLATVIDKSLGNVFGVMETWDAFTHHIALNFPLTGPAFAGIRAGSETAGDIIAGDPVEGFTHLKTAVEDLGETSTVGDYFELEGSAYDLTNLAVSIAFDPVNVVFPGAKGANQVFRRAMTNPKYASLYLNGGSVRAVTKSIANDTGSKALKNVLYLDGLSDDGYRALLTSAQDPNATVGQVEDVLRNEMASGYFLGAGPHRAYRQNTIQGFDKLIDAWNTGKVEDGTFRTLFSQLDHGRTFSLGENQGLANFFDLLHQFNPNNPDEMVRWADEALNAVSRTRPRHAAEGVLETSKQQARDAVAASQSVRRGLGVDVQGVRSNLSAVDDALSRVDEVAPVDLDRAQEGLRQFADQPAVIRNNLERLASGERIPVEAERAQAEAVAGWFHSKKQPTPGLFRGMELDEVPAVGETFDVAIGNATTNADEAARFAQGETEWIVAFGDNTPAAANPANTDVPLVSGRFRVTEVDETHRVLRVSAEHVEDVLPAAGNQVRRSLQAQRLRLRRKLDEAGPVAEQAKEADRLSHRRLSQTRRLEDDLTLNPNRAGLAHVVHRYYDNLAQQINREIGEDVIPIVKGKSNPLAPDVPVRDWTEVTGVKQSSYADEDTLKMVTGLAGDDADLAKDLSALGMFRRSQKVILPASPYQIQLFRKLGGTKTGRAKLHRMAKQEFLSKAVKTTKLAFGVNLLMNPITAGKVTLDETLRFFASEAAPGKFAKATFAGFPGAEGARRGVGETLQKIPGFKQWADDWGEWVTNPYALQHGRGLRGFIGDDAFEWVTRNQAGAGPTKVLTEGEYAQHAERWVNGTLSNDPIFKGYARFYNEATVAKDGSREMPAAFREWWETGLGETPGLTHARTSTFTIGADKKLVENSADFVWERLDTAYRHWLDNWVAGDAPRRQLSRRLIGAASGTQEKLAVTGNDARLLKAIERIPAPVEQGRDGIMSKIAGSGFDSMFGGPSARRGGVFFEHYFDEAMDIYQTRFADNIITPETVQEAAGKAGMDVTLQEAKTMVRSGADNTIVRQLMERTGAKTTRALEAQAARYAQVRADDLMYRMTATSMAGRGVEAGLLFPFARAQLDFLSWWTNHLTTPLKLRPGLAKFLPEQVTQGVQSVPINVRALSKYAHLNATVNNDEPSMFDQAVDKLTFFPTQWNTEIMLDLLPQLGPAPGWMVDGLNSQGLISDDVLGNIEAVFPAAGYGDPNEPFTDRILPNSPRSVRRMAWAGLQAIGSIVGVNPNEWEDGIEGAIANVISDGKKPPATGDITAHRGAEWLSENAFTTDPGSAEAAAAYSELAMKSGFEANQKDSLQALKDVLHPFSGFTREHRSLASYAPVFNPDTFSLLEDFGVLSTSDLHENRLQETWEKFQDGTSTEEDRRYLADSLNRIYRDARKTPITTTEDDSDVFNLGDYLTTAAPGIAVNLITKTECSGAAIRSDKHREFHNAHCDPQTGRLQNIPPGDEGSELVREARLSGWITPRDADGDDGWLKDAHQAIYRSSRRAVDAAWTRVTGRTWAQGSKKSIDDQTISITPFVNTVLKPTGLELEVGESMTVAEYHQLLEDHRNNFRLPGFGFQLIDNSSLGRQFNRSETGRQFLDQIDEAADHFADRGIDNLRDWPEESKEALRNMVADFVTKGDISQADYDREWAGFFGPLDYQPPKPPPVDELEDGVRVSREDVENGGFEVVDGDTVSILMADGPLRVRLVGINAPEVGQEGHSEATQNLIDITSGAEEVVLGIYQPELFGITQRTGPEEQRLFAFLYVDGTPVYDPSVFTSENPRGAGTSGQVLDLQAILEGGAE